MPRRNVWLLIIMLVVCVACYGRAHRYGQVLSFAMDQIDHRALEPAGERMLFEGALRGMMDQLHDRHSVYLPPRPLREVDQSIRQEFGGLGIQVEWDPKAQQLIVATPLFGTPAYEAGIRPGDRILRIDGEPTLRMPLDEAVDRMKGPAGTAVVLTIQHEGDAKPVEMRIVRAVIKTDTVLGYSPNAEGGWNFFLDGRQGIGYVRINTFGERTEEELRQAMKTLLDGGMKGLVLDVRNNPGGLLPSAMRICDLFIASGVIVTIRGREGEIRESVEAAAEGTLPDFPMAVLVNGLTASASEIVAACLQDHGRAIVVGERTFGKGTIQEIVDLPAHEGALKITTASYWRPSGKNINRSKDDQQAEWGVTADSGYEVKLEGEAVEKFKHWRRHHDILTPGSSASTKSGKAEAEQARHQTDVDPQLAKAVEYLDREAKQRTQGLP